jgi:hypothetical protein
MWVMPRTDIYLKVTVDHDRDEEPQKIASQICRQVEKVYSVRKAELSSFLTHETEEPE